MKIGIFDSGLGGLVISKALIEKMPSYDYVYYGDTAHLPYGDKTSGQILAYSIEAIKFLIAQDCAIIIIACNTATSIALRYLQQRFIPNYSPGIKVLGVVIPTVEEAIFPNASKIGVIATTATARSHIYQTELLKINPHLEITEIAAPDLVPMIENNNFEKATKLCQKYARQFSTSDSLILGCTHYPLLKEYFRKLLPGVRIISQDELMGAKLEDYLLRHSEISQQLSQIANYKFWVSQRNDNALAVAERLFPGIIIEQTEKGDSDNLRAN